MTHAMAPERPPSKPRRRVATAIGVILLLNCGIGLITPPVGSVLFVGSAIGGIPMTRALKTIWPFWLACAGVLMLVTFIPALSLWLPSLMK